MLQVSKIIAQGAGLAPVLLKRASTIEIDWDLRQKSRFGTLVRGGDVLVAEDGSMIKVIAAAQPVLRITCPTDGTPFDLTRAAYHLGNRHVPIELKPDHLKIEPDHVLADMLRAMHLIVQEVEEAFKPEGGAYSAAGHSHGHADGHGHAAATAPVLPKAHVHGPDCKHGHDPTHGDAIKPVAIQIHKHKPHSH